MLSSPGRLQLIGASKHCSDIKRSDGITGLRPMYFSADKKCFELGYINNEAALNKSTIRSDKLLFISLLTRLQLDSTSSLTSNRLV